MNRHRQGGFIAGSLLICSAFLFTPETVTRLFSPDGVIASTTILKLNAMRLAAAIVGAFILLLAAFRSHVLDALPRVCRSLPERAGVSLVFFLSLLMVIAFFRGGVGLHLLSYLFAHQALVIQSGQFAPIGLENITGFSTYTWPPGLAILTSPLIMCGLSALRATWLISVLSFAAASATIFEFVRRLTSTSAATMATVLFVFSPILLNQGGMAMAEMPFIFATLFALSALDRYHFSAVCGERRSSILLAVATGALLAVPCWIRYIGIIVPLIGYVSLLILFFVVPSQRTNVAASGLSMTLVLGLLIIPNVVANGSLTNHPLGVEPGDTFSSAILASLWHIAKSALFQIETVPQQVVIITTAALLCGLAAVGLKRPRILPITCFPLVYLVFLAYAASHTRIDPIGERFIIPVLPYLAMSVAILWHSLTDNFQDRSAWKRACRGAMVCVCIILAARGALFMVLGQEPPSMNYSPATIQHIRRHVPAGTGIAGNLSGVQLLAETLDYEFVRLPHDDEYVRAYGGRPWTREEALRVFLEKHVRFVVFFLGENHYDFYLARDAYGKYVSSLLTAEPPEIDAISKTADGIVIQLVDESKLRRIVDNLRSG